MLFFIFPPRKDKFSLFLVEIIISHSRRKQFPRRSSRCPDLSISCLWAGLYWLLLGGDRAFGCRHYISELTQVEEEQEELERGKTRRKRTGNKSKGLEEKRKNYKQESSTFCVVSRKPPSLTLKGLYSVAWL
jgi:hypothetical protein